MVKSMKKILGLFLLVLTLVMTGCQNAGALTEVKEKKQVLATTAILADLVRHVAGDRIEVDVLIYGEMDPHSYELVKGDDEKLQSSSIVFYHGLGLEHGSSLQYQLEHHPFAVNVGDYIVKHHADKLIVVDGVVDPHAWMDVELWSTLIRPITEALSKLDPEGAPIYKTQGEAFQNEMLNTHKVIKDKLQSLPEQKRFLVTSHDAFHYFARSYMAEPKELTTSKWKDRFAAPEGLAPDGQMSPMDIQDIIDFLLSKNIQVVFPESNVSKDSLKKIVHACLEKGLTLTLAEIPLYGDSMGQKGSDADNYLSMMQHNAETIASYLSANQENIGKK